MKPKKINEKLTLNKKTIARLNGMEMDNLKGGATTVTIVVSACLCDTYEPSNCVYSCPSVYQTCSDPEFTCRHRR